MTLPDPGRVPSPAGVDEPPSLETPPSPVLTVAGSMPISAWAAAVCTATPVVVAEAVRDRVLDWGERLTLDMSLTLLTASGVPWRWVGPVLSVGEGDGEATAWCDTLGLSAEDVSGVAEWAQLRWSRVGRYVLIRGEWARVLEVRSVIEAGRGAPAEAYAVELVIISAEESAERRAAIDASVDAAITAAKDAGTALTWAASAALDLALSRAGATVRHHILIPVAAGTPGRWEQGTSIPVPRRTISDAGTVSVSGYDTLQTGTMAEMTVTRAAAGARLVGHVSTGTPTGYVEGVPTIAKSELTVDAVLSLGEWRVLGGADGTRDERGTVGGLLLGAWRRQGADAWTVLARVVRVGA